MKELNSKKIGKSKLKTSADLHERNELFIYRNQIDCVLLKALTIFSLNRCKGFIFNCVSVITTRILIVQSIM